MKKFAMLLAVLLTATGLVTLPATASAATSCSGSLIDRKVVSYGGADIAELAVYFNASTGVNCARMNHLGVTYGHPYRTAVFIVACTETSPASVCDYYGSPDAQDGTYSYYAGPVEVTARGRCIHAAGDIYYPSASNKRHVETSPAASHCG
ncbi:hypothetical protein AB0F52_14605 [Amycolatopsis sp. NPDC024027]|uniref:hypothetical protein n=1 Tax=Amycolatopsis sp. NPDC024027 TaxID=3154327 RepID=UPI0034066042